MVLLHNTKLNADMLSKMQFKWLGPFRIKAAVPDKGTFVLEELDGTQMRGTTAGNRLKVFFPRRVVPVEASEEEIEANARDAPEEIPQEAVRRGRGRPRRIPLSVVDETVEPPPGAFLGVFVPPHKPW
jgi:hypothetical protein